MVRFAIPGLLIMGAGSAHAATIVIFFSPITLDRHTAVYDTPGPDRLLMCMEPPGTAGCTELPMKKRR